VLAGVLRVELELADRRADVGRGANLELGVLLVELGDRRTDVGRGANLELGAVCTTSPPIAAALTPSLPVGLRNGDVPSGQNVVKGSNQSR